MRLNVRLVCSLLLAATVSAQQPQRETKEVDLSTRTAGLQRADGFVPYYWDAKKGELLFELSPAALDHEFLYFTALASGTAALSNGGGTVAFNVAQGYTGTTTITSATVTYFNNGGVAANDVTTAQTQTLVGDIYLTGNATINAGETTQPHGTIKTSKVTPAHARYRDGAASAKSSAAGAAAAICVM